MGLTHGDVTKILEIVDASPHVGEIEFIHSRLHFRIQRGSISMLHRREAPFENVLSSNPPLAPTAPPIIQTEQRHDTREAVIRAPVLGTFYRTFGAAEAPLVELGQRVQAHDSLGLIKTATCLTEIKAGVGGVLTQIFRNHGELVEFDQPLFVIITTVQC